MLILFLVESFQFEGHHVVPCVLLHLSFLHIFLMVYYLDELLQCFPCLLMWMVNVNGVDVAVLVGIGV